jgi:hypothetical protein
MLDQEAIFFGLREPRLGNAARAVLAVSLLICGSSARAQAPPPAPSPPVPASLQAATESHAKVSGVLATLPPSITHVRLTRKDKFEIYIHVTYGPQNFLLPVTQAAYFMTNPPRDVPRDWKDGGGAFGRWYGEQVVASASNRTGQFLAEAALHEDPRYVPSASTNPVIRIFHAIGFTLIDKNDSGHNTFAFSNLAGAAAGGFAGMGLLPNGYNDLPHAERRSLRGLETIAVRNIITEFRPQWEPTLRKIHVPKLLPGWWTPDRSQHP